MTIRYVFGSDPDALHQAMRRVLSLSTLRDCPTPCVPADATGECCTPTTKDTKDKP